MRTIKAKMVGLQPRTDGGGISHDMWVAFVDAEDDDVNIAHASCIIPNDRFSDLLQPMGNADRVALYRLLLMEFYGAQPHGLTPPQHPVGLTNLSAWDAYMDEKDAYDIELATLTADAESMASMAKNWIESLGAFTGWPFSFMLQEGN